MDADYCDKELFVEEILRLSRLAILGGVKNRVVEETGLRIQRCEQARMITKLSFLHSLYYVYIRYISPNWRN